jgi:hypothetical protein
MGLESLDSRDLDNASPSLVHPARCRRSCMCSPSFEVETESDAARRDREHADRMQAIQVFTGVHVGEPINGASFSQENLQPSQPQSLRSLTRSRGCYEF